MFRSLGGFGGSVEGWCNSCWFPVELRGWGPLRVGIRHSL